MKKILLREEKLGESFSVLAVFLDQNSKPIPANARGGISVFSMSDEHTTATIGYINEKTHSIDDENKLRPILDYFHHEYGTNFEIVTECAEIPKLSPTFLNLQETASSLMEACRESVLKKSPFRMKGSTLYVGCSVAKETIKDSILKHREKNTLENESFYGFDLNEDTLSPAVIKESLITYIGVASEISYISKDRNFSITREQLISWEGEALSLISGGGGYSISEAVKESLFDVDLSSLKISPSEEMSSKEDEATSQKP